MANYVSIPRDPSLIAAWSVAQDGMSSSAARFNVVFMPLIDGLTWTRANAVVAGSTNPATYIISGQLKLKGSSVIGYDTPAARTFTRCCGLPHEYRENRFSFADPGVYTQYDSSSEGEVHWQIDLPVNATLTRVEIDIKPAVHVALPSVMPKIQVIAFDSTVLTGGNDFTIADTSDGSTLAVYNTEHTILVNVSYPMPTDGKRYVCVRFKGESGTNRVDGLLVRPPRFTFTRATLEQD